MNKLFFGVGVFVMGLVVVLACVPKEDVLSPEEWLSVQLAKVDQTQLGKDLKLIGDSLIKWNTIALQEPRGVRYVIHEMGTGDKPGLSNKVTVKFSGKLLSSKAVFAPTDTLTIELYDLILGWQTTMPEFPKGTKATLYIPSGLGYGPIDITENSKVIIPRNSNLIFDIELLDVK